MVRHLSCTEVAFEIDTELGEGPVWDERTDSLMFIDIRGRVVHRVELGSGIDTPFSTDQMIGSVGLRADGGYVLTLEDGFFFAEANGEDLRRAGTLAVDPELLRFNDGKVDPLGRFISGTTDLANYGAHTSGSAQAGGPDGALFALSPDGTITKLVDQVTISNGMEWTPDGKTFFYIDTATSGIDAFDLDQETGNLVNRRRAVTADPSLGRLDGMTVDEQGCIWVACFRGGCVCRYSPQGNLDTIVSLPTTNTTSVAFGGSHLDHLFITTARRLLTEQELANEPLAGKVFVFETSTRGFLQRRFGDI